MPKKVVLSLRKAGERIAVNNRHLYRLLGCLCIVFCLFSSIIVLAQSAVSKNTRLHIMPCLFRAKQKSLKTFYRFSSSYSSGDERIELPPKVLETPIIPFDQSPIFNFKVCTLKTTHIISYFFELCKYFFQFPITL